MKITLFTSRERSPSIIGEDLCDSAVLFVHGLGGSYWTWNKFSIHLKKYWNEKDSFDLEYDEYYVNQGLVHSIPLLNFFQKIWKIWTGPNIELLSQHLKTVIDQVCHDYENVIIVAHSMGGLVARKYIVDILKETKTIGKVKALITYATPHKGSYWGNRYQMLCYYCFGNMLGNSKQVLELSKGGIFLPELNKMWSNLRVEDKLKFIRVVGCDDWVVDIDSASYKLDGDVRMIANKNHFSIIKPVREKDPAFMVTYNYLKDFRDNLENEEENQEDYDINRENLS